MQTMTLHFHAAPSQAGRQLPWPMTSGRQFNVPILRSGILARAFCRHARVAEVAAVFDRSLYLRAGDVFICIGKLDMGNGPLTLIADAPFRLSDLAVNPGQSALISERRIRIGGSVQFTLDRFELWRTPHWPTPLSPDRLTGAAEALARLAIIEAPREGLARQVLCSHAGGLLSRIARRRIASFKDWLSDALKANDAAEDVLPRPVRGLIGLGCGLTPSGDDFLVGALALLDALAERKAFESLGYGLTHASPALTSPLSHCFLRAAAAGYVGENLYQTVSSIVAGKVDSAITAIRKIGHSSGWDMLTGIAITLKIFATARLEPRGCPPGDVMPN
jgi:Protein of unknown function (DUF2877)